MNLVSAIVQPTPTEDHSLAQPLDTAIGDLMIESINFVIYTIKHKKIWRELEIFYFLVIRVSLQELIKHIFDFVILVLIQLGGNYWFDRGCFSIGN